MIKPSISFKIGRFENAQTMVEFALVFPIILVITYGIMEFGRMMFIYAEVTGAAREGARYGVASGTAPGSSPATPYYAYCTGIDQAARKITLLIPPSNVNVSVKYTAGSTTTIKLTCPFTYSLSTDSIVQGDRVRVEVNVFYQPILGSFLGISGFNINSVNFRTILKTIDFNN